MQSGGHPVSGLARDVQFAQRPMASGIDPMAGPEDLIDLPSISHAIKAYDAVVFAPFVPFDDEPPVIHALIDMLTGTNKTLIYTSGTGVLSIDPRGGEWREENFQEDDPAYVPRHRLSKRIEDLAELYRLVILNGSPGALYHAVAGEVNWRTLAEAVAQVMGCATTSVTASEAAEIWGPLIADLYFCISSRSRAVRSREELGWKATLFDLVDDIRAGSYRERYQPGKGRSQ